MYDPLKITGLYIQVVEGKVRYACFDFLQRSTTGKYRANLDLTGCVSLKKDGLSLLWLCDHPSSTGSKAKGNLSKATQLPSQVQPLYQRESKGCFVKYGKDYLIDFHLISTEPCSSSVQVPNPDPPLQSSGVN